LQYRPIVRSTNVEPPSTNVNREKYEKALLQYPQIQTGLRITDKQRNNAASTLQSAVRRKQSIMKHSQLVGEEKLRQLEAAKDKTIKDDAAFKLQAALKRKQQPTIKQMKALPQRIGAASKRLFTERVDSSYVPAKKDANGNILNPDKTVIWNKKTVGQPLAVSTRGQKLISKKKQTAAVEGWGHRHAYLDLAEKYKDIMTKGKKK